ncbi:MAG: teichoic acid biosynthesis protein [Deltaproteobacteria bacterium]|nr:teichoic acid biosynthesis protein [Deltaproteobacteria bacterium]
MKILYGVVGEGMGHAMRSAVILERLVGAGHDVRIVGSGRAAEYLERAHPDRVTTITGLTMVYEDNEVRKLKTLLQNLKAAAGIPENVRAYLEMARDFSPDVVVSDFESWTYAFARGQGVPIVSVDNMQVIDRCTHDRALLGDEWASFLLAKGIVRNKLPRANAYLITTFFFPPLRKDRSSLHPPILRRIILDAKARVSPGEHVLVYQTGTSHGGLLDALRAVDVPFRIYGMRRDLTAPVTEGNLCFCPFSEDQFTADLASSRAVLAGGGFTLMGEAIYLGKPMLSIPLVGQFEQVLNASYLQKLGYGERTSEISREGLRSFLDKTPWYQERLAAFEHDRNEGFFSALNGAIAAAIGEGSLP